MSIRLRSLAAFFCLFLCGPSMALAQTEWRVNKVVKLDRPPMDMLVSADNKWIFVLNDQGQIVIYTTSGQLKDTIQVGRDVDQIKTEPRGDRLFLLSSKTNTIQFITIDFTESIHIEGSPIKGLAEAPVAIAVFSDFQ